MFLYSLRPETASKIGQQRAQGPGTKGTAAPLLKKPWSGTLWILKVKPTKSWPCTEHWWLESLKEYWEDISLLCVHVIALLCGLKSKFVAQVAAQKLWQSIDAGKAGHFLIGKKDEVGTCSNMFRCCGCWATSYRCADLLTLSQTSDWLAFCVRRFDQELEFSSWIPFRCVTHSFCFFDLIWFDPLSDLLKDPDLLPWLSLCTLSLAQLRASQRINHLGVEIVYA